MILFRKYIEKYQNENEIFCLDACIQANLYLIFEGRNGVSRLFPKKKLQPKFGATQDFCKKIQPFLMGCAYFPLKVWF